MLREHNAHSKKARNGITVSELSYSRCSGGGINTHGHNPSLHRYAPCANVHKPEKSQFASGVACFLERYNSGCLVCVSVHTHLVSSGRVIYLNSVLNKRLGRLSLLELRLFDFAYIACTLWRVEYARCFTRTAYPQSKPSARRVACGNTRTALPQSGIGLDAARRSYL